MEAVVERFCRQRQARLCLLVESLRLESQTPDVDGVAKAAKTLLDAIDDAHTFGPDKKPRGLLCVLLARMCSDHSSRKRMTKRGMVGGFETRAALLAKLSKRLDRQRFEERDLALEGLLRLVHRRLSSMTRTDLAVFVTAFSQARVFFGEGQPASARDACLIVMRGMSLLGFDQQQHPLLDNVMNDNATAVSEFTGLLSLLSFFAKNVVLSLDNAVAMESDAVMSMTTTTTTTTTASITKNKEPTDIPEAAVVVSFGLFLNQASVTADNASLPAWWDGVNQVRDEYLNLVLAPGVLSSLRALMEQALADGNEPSSIPASVLEDDIDNDSELNEGGPLMLQQGPDDKFVGMTMQAVSRAHACLEILNSLIRLFGANADVSNLQTLCMLTASLFANRRWLCATFWDAFDAFSERRLDELKPTYEGVCSLLDHAYNIARDAKGPSPTEAILVRMLPLLTLLSALCATDDLTDQVFAALDLDLLPTLAMVLATTLQETEEIVVGGKSGGGGENPNLDDETITGVNGTLDAIVRLSNIGPQSRRMVATSFGQQRATVDALYRVVAGTAKSPESAVQALSVLATIVELSPVHDVVLSRLGRSVGVEAMACLVSHDDATVRMRCSEVVLKLVRSLDKVMFGSLSSLSAPTKDAVEFLGMVLSGVTQGIAMLPSMSSQKARTEDTSFAVHMILACRTLLDVCRRGSTMHPDEDVRQALVDTRNVVIDRVSRCSVFESVVHLAAKPILFTTTAQSFGSAQDDKVAHQSAGVAISRVATIALGLLRCWCSEVLRAAWPLQGDPWLQGLLFSPASTQQGNVDSNLSMFPTLSSSNPTNIDLLIWMATDSSSICAVAALKVLCGLVRMFGMQSNGTGAEAVRDLLQQTSLTTILQKDGNSSTGPMPVSEGDKHQQRLYETEISVLVRDIVLAGKGIVLERLIGTDPSFFVGLCDKIQTAVDGCSGSNANADNGLTFQVQQASASLTVLLVSKSCGVSAQVSAAVASATDTIGLSENLWRLITTVVLSPKEKEHCAMLDLLANAITYLSWHMAQTQQADAQIDLAKCVQKLLSHCRVDDAAERIRSACATLKNKHGLSNVTTLWDSPFATSSSFVVDNEVSNVDAVEENGFGNDIDTPLVISSFRWKQASAAVFVNRVISTDGTGRHVEDDNDDDNNDREEISKAMKDLIVASVVVSYRLKMLNVVQKFVQVQSIVTKPSGPTAVSQSSAILRFVKNTFEDMTALNGLPWAEGLVASVFPSLVSLVMIAAENAKASNNALDAAVFVVSVCEIARDLKSVVRDTKVSYMRIAVKENLHPFFMLCFVTNRVLNCSTLPMFRFTHAHTPKRLHRWSADGNRSCCLRRRLRSTPSSEQELIQRNVLMA